MIAAQFTHSGFVFYRGPSMLDGEPIVTILTGLDKASSNTKTGGLFQTFILREDVSPVEAIHTGADASICGNCPHRGTISEDGRNTSRSCYVTVFQAPLVTWKTYRRNRYAELSPEHAAELVRNGIVRLGAYGDPAAVPFAVWHTLLQHVRAKTGYSHQWRDPRFADFKAYCMASCDTPQDFAQAKAQGWRTFRVRTAQEAVKPSEIVCPASAEKGHKTTCAACVACGGTSAKARADVVIIAHGAVGKTNAYARLRAA
jgi:hypothetical protein